VEGNEGQVQQARARILIVDDEDAIRQLVAVLLRDFADVNEAQNAEEAMLSLEKETPDIILLDARLPDMAGADVARAIRNRRETQGTPIVMVTGDPDRPAADAGINVFLRKPFDLEELRACVLDLLGR
jgi:two-component system, OmpR family, phosphate regulon response regulator PhoB